MKRMGTLWWEEQVRDRRGKGFRVSGGRILKCFVCTHENSIRHLGLVSHWYPCTHEFEARLIT
jgi:hypothetical protein